MRPYNEHTALFEGRGVLLPSGPVLPSGEVAFVATLPCAFERCVQCCVPLRACEVVCMIWVWVSCCVGGDVFLFVLC